MKLRVMLALASLLCAAQAGRASDPVGVYGLIDKVEFEPSEGQAPNRVRVHGVFAVAIPKTRNDYTEPVKGFIYFSLPEKKPDQARREWNDLKKLAGTKQCVAFASRYKIDGVKVRNDKDVSKGAVAYHLEVGLTKLPENDHMAQKLLAFKPKP